MPYAAQSERMQLASGLGGKPPPSAYTASNRSAMPRPRRHVSARAGESEVTTKREYPSPFSPRRSSPRRGDVGMSFPRERLRAKAASAAEGETSPPYPKAEKTSRAARAICAYVPPHRMLFQNGGNARGRGAAFRRQLRRRSLRDGYPERGKIEQRSVFIENDPLPHTHLSAAQKNRNHYIIKKCALQAPGKNSCGGFSRAAPRLSPDRKNAPASGRFCVFIPFRRFCRSSFCTFCRCRRGRGRCGPASCSPSAGASRRCFRARWSKAARYPRRAWAPLPGAPSGG